MSLLGERLRQEREARGLALLQIEIDTRIRANVIQSLENGEWENLPPEPFLRGLLRSYANYLRVDPQQFLDLYTADTAPMPPQPPARPSSVRRPLASPHPPATRPRGYEQQQEETPAPIPVSEVKPEPKPEPPPPPPPKPEPKPEPPPPPKPEPRSTPPAPSSMPEPLVRRRLPLAPPSPKPKTTLLPIGDLPPPGPPETLPAPELLSAAEAGESVQKEGPQQSPPQEDAEKGPIALLRARRLARRVRARVPRRLESLPTPVLALGAGLALLLLLAFIVFAIAQIVPTVASIAMPAQTSTPTRVARTATPTGIPGASPTSIPMIAATAPPFTPIPIAVPATAIPKPTSRTTPGASGAGLNIDVDANQTVTVQVGVDGTMVFTGPIAAGSSRSWAAKESLYFRIENFIGATVTFNSRKQVALNFPERTIWERQWNIGANGRVVAVSPVPPTGATRTRVPATPISSIVIPSSTPAPSATAAHTPAPSATTADTPAPSATTPNTPAPSATTADTPAPSPTSVPTDTPTRAGPTPTLTPFY